MATLFAVPLAVAIALGIHWFAAKKEPPNETQLYSYFLSGLLAAGIAAATLPPSWSGLTRVDADRLPPHRGRRFVPDRVGIGDRRLPLASFALLPQPRGGVAESDQ